MYALSMFSLPFKTGLEWRLTNMYKSAYENLCFHMNFTKLMSNTEKRVRVFRMRTITYYFLFKIINGTGNII